MRSDFSSKVLYGGCGSRVPRYNIAVYPRLKGCEREKKVLNMHRDILVGMNRVGITGSSVKTGRTRLATLQ